MSNRGKGGFHNLGDRRVSLSVDLIDTDDRFPTSSTETHLPSGSDRSSQAIVSQVSAALDSAMISQVSPVTTPTVISQASLITELTILSPPSMATNPTIIKLDSITYPAPIGPTWPLGHRHCWRCMVPHKDLAQCNAMNAVCTRCFLVGHFERGCPEYPPHLRHVWSSTWSAVSARANVP